MWDDRTSVALPPVFLLLVTEGIAIGRTFPFLGDPEATWANVEETIKREIGGPYPLRRNNRQKVRRQNTLNEQGEVRKNNRQT